MYSKQELIEKIRQLDEKIEQAASQVSFNGRTVTYQVNAWKEQRDRYQTMLIQLNKQKRTSSIKYIKFTE